MTKGQFENYTKGTIYCECCKRTLDKHYVNYGKLRMDGTTSRCKACDWIYRHNGCPDIKGYTEEQIRYVLEFILCTKSVFLNDLTDELNLTLEQIIEIVNVLKIGNKHYRVKTSCVYCGKLVEEVVSVYLQHKNLYCSHRCYWKDKSKYSGRESPFYKRIQTSCTNCGKTLEIRPSAYNETNKFGDNHNFCSRDCYWEYRSKYYVEEKASRYNAVVSPEHLEKMRKMFAEKQKDSSRLNTKIQICVNQILDKNNIKYEREHVVKYFSIDNYLIESKLFVEVMGDYWHTSPLKYNESKYMINKTQQRGLQHDKQKHTYIKNHFDKEILYLWEDDINTNIEMCEQLILKYIKFDGKLDNYHSFNWTWIDDELRLKDEIIVPYQDMKIDNYRKLLKL